ncbi:polyprenol phosphomannose-dependent alpha 1,6 mannosyltransferase MptB, partial [Allorhizocola rhizosphaerae]|uniref:polyprenol phosphomannose-dependent alpha 1,6 mannosyltransferase MptB n=1 Tax=Allorhizocola rhizosphaerae TaxID=1872709 RepID=UPI0014793A22
DLVTGLIGMRLAALAGLAALLACLPALARRCGADPAEALWLGALNPLVLLHVVAGAHNEALMLGLLGAGLTVAFRHRFALATVLITLAALIKAPAVLGLAVVASLWHKTLRVGVIALTTTVVVTELTGVGYGWIGAVHTSAAPHAWSLTTAIGRLFGTQMAMVFWVSMGLAATVAICVIVWLRRRRLGEVYALGLGLAAIGMLGPATRPWYALWGLVPLAASAPRGRVRHWAAAVSTGLTFILLPNGFGVVTL